MSMYSFQPIFPPWVVAMWLLVCLGLILHGWRRQAETMPPRIRRALFGLRLAGLALLTAFLLRPWRETSTPKSGASRVVVLLDSSASMFDHADATDRQGPPRRRWDAALAALPETFPGPAELYRFSDQGLLPCPANLGETTALPGETALGTALEEALSSRQRPGALPLAAVVLLSDGAETAPGSSLVETARHARALKIPVSTLCLGSPEIPPNATAVWQTRRLTVAQGEPFQLTAKALSDFPDTIAANLTIHDNSGQLLTKQDILLRPNEASVLQFDLPPIAQAGDYAFTIRVTGQGADGRPSDDSDTALIHVEAPPHRKLLFLSANPGWEWRFLRLVAEHANDMEISAIVRIGRDAEANAALPSDFRPARLYHHFHLPESQDDLGFPGEPGDYADFDGVVLACSAAAQFTPQQCDALLAFVERKGGGLLLTGNPAELPEALLRVLPARDFEIRQAAAQNSLQGNCDFIFDAETASRLSGGKAALPRGTHYLAAQTPKPAARIALADEHGGAILVAQGNYGAGRVAWLGLEESWRWCLAPGETDGLALHREFWETLLEWLGHNRQPVLRLEMPSEESAVGQPVALAAWVTGPDFLPAPAAQVQVRIACPDQTTKLLTLSPAPEELGLFQTEFLPETAGAYTADFTALATPEALAVTAKGVFLARDISREAAEAGANPDLLADTARITGGATLQAPVNWSKLPLSPNSPQNITRAFLLENLACALLLILLWGTEWWLRRHHGLK
ncbi:MAG: VWA domain-containing protein [Victivallales bacterium]|nr:VWA domain-containing protein [Victivallales bacterium]